MAARMRNALNALSILFDGFGDGNVRKGFQSGVRNRHPFPFPFGRADRRGYERRQSPFAGDDGEMRQPSARPGNDGDDVIGKRFGKRRKKAFYENDYGVGFVRFEIRERDEFSGCGTFGEFRPGKSRRRFDADLGETDFGRTARWRMDADLRRRTVQRGTDDGNGASGFAEEIERQPGRGAFRRRFRETVGIRERRGEFGNVAERK